MSQNTLPLGVISEGSLRVEDLGNAIVNALSEIALFFPEWLVISEWNTIAGDEGNEDPDTLDGLLSDLLSIAERYAPDGAYVGMHEGDGACLGVWEISPEGEE